jgi:prevent-host-death family protein
MNFFTQIKPVSYLQSHAEDIVKSLAESREPLLITQNGEAKLVVMDVQSYEEHEATLALLKVLALGGREIEQGQFRATTDVFAELEQEDTQ